VDKRKKKIEKILEILEWKKRRIEKDRDRWRINIITLVYSDFVPRLLTAISYVKFAAETEYEVRQWESKTVFEIMLNFDFLSSEKN